MNSALRTAFAFILTLAFAQAASPPIPVVVELFTSEGCSSCPPADLLLSRLQQAQPISGVQVIALSEHVDYWNELGWTDPFSSSALTTRQQRYAHAIHDTDSYTPQMVVDGTVAFVGSDGRKAIDVITAAAKSAKAKIDLRCASNPPVIQIRMDSVSAPDADVVLAITENGLQSKVGGGENRGRLMEHSSVTRRMTNVGRSKKGQGLAIEKSLVVEKSWKRENVSAVVFLQDRANFRILSAAQIPLSGCPAKF